jgi:hypothetical protein
MIGPGREVFCHGEESRDVSSTAYALPTPELVLDRYRPLRPIGRGGSGSVWLARDERTGLEVALKIVPREGKRASRAAREMEAASRLRHDRCVRAYDFGGDSGHVYIAYEYVQGQTMREALRAGKLSDGDAIEAAAQILDALAHAHHIGIVHRDVKPSNVLVEEGAELSIKLLDFGLAQFDEADTLTAVGDVPGTLAYIAPERLTGEEATTASDVWAVGVLLWESLAGEHPFWGVPLPQVAAAIESGAPPLASVRSDLRPAVADAVSSALVVEPAKRPSAERLARDLRAAVTSPRRDRTTPARQRETAATPKVAAAPLPLEQRLVPAGLAAVAVVIGATLVPFWTPGLTILLTVAAALATLRSPRLGLAVALFIPVFPLGNVAQAAAIAYATLAALWLALWWRDARSGLLFMAGPVLAMIGAVALLPLAVQPARGRARRALQAFAGVFAAVAVAGLREGTLPLTGHAISNLGVDGSTSLFTVVGPVIALLQANPWFVALAAVLAAAAALLPDARKRGFRGIALLGVCQMGLLLFLAPALPALPIVLGTLALCAILAARTFQAGRYP